jgi:uncharacterized protein (TIGR01319 family)
MSDRRFAVAIDFGSTFTKVCVADLRERRFIAAAAHPTTGADLRDGFRRALEHLEGENLLSDAYVVACSSAGGGLRITVAGLEDDLTVRAGRYAAMSAGARVVQTVSGGVDPAAVAAADPDLIVLTGGLDGGDEECLVGNARALAASDLRVPVVIAGNAAAAGRAADALARTDLAVTVSPNVMPSAGVLNVAPARARIREIFIRHVIGGRQVNGSSELREMIRMATPDAVLLGTEILAESWCRDIVVLDVGGATTDVHSCVRTPMGRHGAGVRLTPEPPASRTVEADLGVWSNAESLVSAAGRDGLLTAERAAGISALLPRRFSDSGDGQPDDLELATLACHLAVRRHAGRLRTRVGRDGVVVESEGKDLRSVSAAVGTGGVFRRADPRLAGDALRAAAHRGSAGERRLLPGAVEPAVDGGYALGACGLISTIDRALATQLLAEAIPKPEPAGP